jgi:hypothetical protein
LSVESRLVERLHAVLVEEIRARRPQYLQQPFTVAEIYQDLVPYRSHRDRIGAAMNGDYEHALLKLLAGEGDFVVLESEQARKRMLSELESSNPNTGIFRDYAALDVWLNPARIPEGHAAAAPPGPAHAAAAEPASPGGSQPELSWDLALADKPAVRARGEPKVPRASAPRAEPRAAERPALQPKRTVKPATEEVRTSAPSNCRWCKSELPKRDNLKFCPFCGVDVALVPCPFCAEKVEVGWRFCIVCGTEVPRDG